MHEQIEAYWGQKLGPDGKWYTDQVFDTYMKAEDWFNMLFKNGLSLNTFRIVETYIAP